MAPVAGSITGVAVMPISGAMLGIWLSAIESVLQPVHPWTLSPRKERFHTGVLESVVAPAGTSKA